VDQQPSAAPPSCYRHPGRPTRLSCSECGRYICPECSVDAVVGQKCSECAAPSERYRVIPARQVTRANRSLTPVALTLMVINVVVHLAGMGSDNLQSEIMDRFAHYTRDVGDGEWWRLISATFLHSPVNLMHILFNMYALWIFGPVLERRFGSLSFASLYLAAGLGAGALFQALNAGTNAGAVGASGAIFGLFGALLAASFRQRHTPAGRAVFSQLALLLALNLALPFLISGIAWEAHLGGLAVGMLVALAWERIPRDTGNAVLQRVAITTAIAIASIAAVFVV
jgi:membrane associated rhomboid family serine protease